MALVAVQTSPFPGNKLTISAAHGKFEYFYFLLFERRKTRACTKMLSAPDLLVFTYIFTRLVLPIEESTFFLLLGNLQKIPASQLEEGLLLCKTLQREKLSTRF